MTPVIALLTDFGTDDIYVGIMKGVILGIAPDARLVDLTHAIQPQNVPQAAFALLNAYGYFPPTTIFCVVVDPGVGSARKALVAEAGGYHFVAPDNGIVSYALRELGPRAVYEARRSIYRRDVISSTFHGRDIFAPAAAYLAAGVLPEDFGPPIRTPVMLPEPEFEQAATHLTGRVIHMDHFGNAVTSIGVLAWQDAHRLAVFPRFRVVPETVGFTAALARIRAGRHTLSGVQRTYLSAQPGDALALVGSSGYLEIAVNQGSAAQQLGLSVGDAVTVEFGPAS